MDFKDSIHNRLLTEKKSNFRKYQEMFIGKYDLVSLIQFEFIANFLRLIPGAVGLVLRKYAYKSLFASVGSNVIFGCNITIRHPHEIVIGNNVIIDDNCLLDAKGNRREGIILRDNIIIGRNSSLTCKEGRIIVSSNTQITSDVSIEMVGGNLVIGEYVGIGAGTRLIGGSHPLREKIDESSVPEWMIPAISEGIVLEDRVFLGANVTVLDGVTIGRNTVVGAGSLVTSDLPKNIIAAGVPAKIIRQRNIPKNDESY